MCRMARRPVRDVHGCCHLTCVPEHAMGKCSHRLQGPGCRIHRASLSFDTATVWEQTCCPTPSSEARQRRFRRSVGLSRQSEPGASDAPCGARVEQRARVWTCGARALHRVVWQRTDVLRPANASSEKIDRVQQRVGEAGGRLRARLAERKHTLGTQPQASTKCCQVTLNLRVAFWPVKLGCLYSSEA